MAKNVDCSDVRPNTIEENDRILRQLRDKHQVNDVNARDLKKLILRLNRTNVSKRRKSIEHVTLPWQDKNDQKILYGPIPNFPPGSWWGIRMDCSRDHVHDPFNLDIHSGPMGAVSVCTSAANINEDVDFGDFLTLTGQLHNDSLRDKDPLVLNYKNQVPLRLIRSYNLTNSYAPKTGYRYDGLYIVIAYWTGVSSTKQKYNKFALMRAGDEDPAPWNSSTQSVPVLAASIPNNISQCSPCCTYKLRKSTNSKDTLNIGTISTLDQQKLADSTILTRRVFKKTETNSENASVPSTSSLSNQEALQNFGARSPETHSTNISIRTNLYDSSHSVQQDVKKNSLISFCRTLKPMSAAKHVVLQKNVNRRINPLRYPSAVGNQTNAKFKSSSGDCLQAQKERQMRVQNIHPKHIYTSSEHKSMQHVPYKEILLSKESNDADRILTHSAEESKSRTSITVLAMKEDSNDPTNNAYVDTKNVNVINSPSEVPQDLLNSTDLLEQKSSTECAAEDCVTDTPIDSSPTVRELKVFESYNSLTPDKILNLIDEEKCRPLSKLLIGNMIGLLPEESVILDTKPLLNEKNVKTEDTINYTNRRDEKFEVSSRQSDSNTKHEQILHGVKRTGANDSSTSKENAMSMDSDSKVKSNLRIFKLESNNDQEDSGKAKKTQLKIAKKRSTVKRIIKSSIKRPMYRKQRREITNLLIDAKIGPKIRGPRNRRLRHINDIYSKKRGYDSFSTIIYAGKKPKRNIHEKKQKQNSDTSERTGKKFELQDISSRKRHAGVNKIEHRFNHLRSNDTNNNTNKNDNNLRSVDTDSKNCKPLPTLAKSKKRRTVQATTESHRIGSTKRARQFCHKEQIAKPCTSDATTQCSFLSDFSGDSCFTTNGFAGWNNRSQGCSVDPHIRDFKAEIKTDAADGGWEKNACHSDSSAKSLHDSAYSPKNSCGRGESCGTAERVPVEEKFNAQSDTKAPSSRTNDQLTERSISAFVPVNAIDNESRIAQLRSIGFKPITSQSGDKLDQESESSLGSGSSCVDESRTYESKVVKRDVAEEYNKYASEENDVVIYMDEELQYQDIEEEEQEEEDDHDHDHADEDEDEDDEEGESVYSVTKEHVTPISTPAESLDSSTEFVDEEANCKGYSTEKDLESPWHGWRKVTTNGKVYWIGW